MGSKPGVGMASPSPELDENARYLALQSPTSPTRTRSRPTNSSTHARNQDTGFSKRSIKTNPLFTGRRASDGREARRTLFLKRVKEDRENKRWEDRGGDEEILRVIWVAEERRRRERVEAEAKEVVPPTWDDDVLAEEMEMSPPEQHAATAFAEQHWQASMVEEIATFEQEALDALVETNEVSMSGFEDAQHNKTPATLEVSFHQPHHGEHLLTDTPYASDDDEYDTLFREAFMDELPPDINKFIDNHDSMDLS